MVLAGVSKAKASVRAAFANYEAAKQTLIQSTITDYLTVVQDAATVQYDLAYTQELYQLLKQQEQKYKVGIIPVTDVYQAQSNYDQQLSTNIKDRNTLDNDIEQLRALTGHSYTSILGVGESLPLHSPNPNSMKKWVNTALAQNLGIIGAIAQVDVDKATVSSDRGYLPNLSFQASYDQTSNRNKKLTRLIVEPNVTSGALTLSMPLFHGGELWAQAKQDSYTTEADQATLDATRRSTVATTRSNYLDVLAAISGVHAANSLHFYGNPKATQAGYQMV